MFTGIIESVSKIQTIKTSGKTTILTITRPDTFTILSFGDSIACDGICLTVTDFTREEFSVEVMAETLAKSTATEWKAGRELNLERALKLGGRLNGHWVQGHIDCTSVLLDKASRNGTLYLRFQINAKDKPLLIPQGSIAINGVSLTIAELADTRFTVALIGHTVQNTNLSQLLQHDKVNLEYDLVGKYLLRFRTADKPQITEEWLHEQGF